MTSLLIGRYLAICVAKNKQDIILSNLLQCQASLLRRLNSARVELEFGAEPGNFDIVIVNDNLDTAYQELKVELLKHVPQ